MLHQNNLLAKYKLKQIGIFGSLARGEEAHDIDILIEYPVDYKKLIAFRTELSQLTGKTVDIVLEAYANPIILHRAKKDIRYVIQPEKRPTAPTQHT